jgi:hypothetical protein
MLDFDLNKSATKKRLPEFAAKLQEISEKVGFKQSARGWCYQLEVAGFIDKSEFPKVEKLINRCRKEGILPIDFTAEEEGRQFSGVVKPDEFLPIQTISHWLSVALNDSGNNYEPNWWLGEKYYIQMLVEKIDLKTLFEPVCNKYKIPIATSKGWSSMLQRANYAKRFEHAEAKGLKPLLLYCGDHDPDGLRISDAIQKNLEDIKDIVWDDGDSGYDPKNLKIVRFGLNKDFIDKHNLSWIDNLITGSGQDLGNPKHKNHDMTYVQDYLKTIGRRKCEANAIVVIPEVARAFVDSVIKSFLGDNAEERFKAKRQAAKDEIKNYLRNSGLDTTLQNAIYMIEATVRGDN